MANNYCVNLPEEHDDAQHFYTGDWTDFFKCMPKYIANLKYENLEPAQKITDWGKRRQQSHCERIRWHSTSSIRWRCFHVERLPRFKHDLPSLPHIVWRRQRDPQWHTKLTDHSFSLRKSFTFASKRNHPVTRWDTVFRIPLLLACSGEYKKECFVFSLFRNNEIFHGCDSECRNLKVCEWSPAIWLDIVWFFLFIQS